MCTEARSARLEHSLALTYGQAERFLKQLTRLAHHSAAAPPDLTGSNCSLA